MEIERINEDTVKFYVSYLDIEKRGFHRDEIWYNREKSEELFWEIMEEVNYQEDFEVEGPLWIQVQALGMGLEFTVTRARLSASELEEFETKMEELAENGDKSIVNNEEMQELLRQQFMPPTPNPEIIESPEDRGDEDNFSLIVKFKDFEHIIQLSHSLNEVVDDVYDRLFYYEDDYYLYMEFNEYIFDDDSQEDIISLTLEFAEEADITIHILEEYGRIIFENQTFAQVRSYFPS